MRVRVLLIGSTSVIGQAIAMRLKSTCSVSTAGRQHADIPFDLTTFQPTNINENFDVVIHVAADFGGSLNSDFIRAELVNSVGTLLVCSLAQQVGAKHLIMLSSISATYQKNNAYYGIYALSKRHGEELAQFFCDERQLKLTVLRPSQVYDAAGNCRKHQALLYHIADQAQAGTDINFFGSHDAKRNYIYLDDIVEICCRVVEKGLAGTYYCVHTESPKLSEIANAAFAVFGGNGKVNFNTDKQDIKDLPNVEDYTLYNLINYYPQNNISDGFMHIKQYRDNHS